MEAPPAEAVQTLAPETPRPADRYEPALPIDLLTPSASNPRKTFNEQYLAQLAENLKTRGQIQPILVRAVDVSGDTVNQYEIVVGECRYRAAKLAGLPTLMATVRDVNDVDVLKIQLDENAKRQDISPLEEAAAYQELMRKAGWDPKQLADDQKVSVRHVYSRLALLKLPKDVSKALAEGKITAVHAEVIAGLKTKELQEQALEGAWTQHFDLPGSDGMCGSDELPATVPIRDFKQWVKRDLLRNLALAPWDKDEEGLVEGAPACAGCPFRSSCNPDLFAEADDDVCHGADCYNAKMQAHMKRRQQEFRKEGQEAVLVSRSWSSDMKGALAKGRWEESKAKNAVVGIVVDGPDRGKEIRVKVAKAQASSMGSGGPTKEEREAAAERHRKADEKRKFDAKVALRIFMELARRAPKVLDLPTLRRLVRSNRVWPRDAEKQDIEELAKITGLKKQSYRVSDKDVEKLTEQQCIASLFLAVFDDYLGEYSDNRAPLFAAAKKLGVDVDAVKEKLKADIAGVPAKKPKRTTAVIRNIETGEIEPLDGKVPSGWERGYVDENGDYHKGDEPAKDSDKISAKEIKNKVAAAKKAKTPKAKKRSKKAK